MKERIVESWLNKINERGYGVPFCQVLASKGHRVIRYGHSPVELGKDVIAIAPDGAVWAYQMKSGDVALSDVNKHIAQLQMLAATRPVHPSLGESYDYRICLVTTGEFKDPAIALIKELNAQWRANKWPELQVLSGKELLVDLLAMSSDFWPSDAPSMRSFLELYLSSGNGDFEQQMLAELIESILGEACSNREFERRAAAANLFCSYILGAFYEIGNHWSIVEAWTICAAAIARASELSGYSSNYWRPAFDLAREGAIASLLTLRKEVLEEGAFRVGDRELDEYTRVRNTLSLAAGIVGEFVESRWLSGSASTEQLLKLCSNFIENGRLLFWGEGAFNQFCVIIWFLDACGRQDMSCQLIQVLMSKIIASCGKEPTDTLESPYMQADQWLVKLMSGLGTKRGNPRRMAVQSYTLAPLVILAARRDMKPILEGIWRDLTHIRMTWFRPPNAPDMLRWHCDTGREEDVGFDQPQSWAELRKFASKSQEDLLPAILRDDAFFSLIFVLVFPHRISLKLSRFLDMETRRLSSSSAS